jgi:hypothetical protein
VCADLLPGVIVAGAMKCATSAVHAYLDVHAEVAMSSLKELNFFNGPAVAPHRDADSWWVTGRHVGADEGWHDERQAQCHHIAGFRVEVEPEVRAEFAERVGDDVDRMQDLLGDPIAEWAR